MSIKYKILLILLLLAFVTHTLITSVYYINSQKLVKKLATYHLVSMANVQQQRMNGFIANNIEKLKLITSRTQMRRSFASYQQNQNKAHIKLIKKILLDATEQAKSIEDIWLLDTTGKVVVSGQGHNLNRSYSNHHLFLNAKKATSANLLLNEREGQIPTIIFSAPLYLEQQLLGVVAMQVNMERLFEFLRDYSGLGKTGEVLMATESSQGNILFFTPLRFEHFPQLFNRNSAIASLYKTEREESDDELLIANDYRNKTVYAISHFLPELDIVIIVKMDQDEVLSFNKELQQLIVYLIFFLILVVLIASVILAHKITRPVITITEVAVMISRGELKKRINEYSDDELGKLAQALNTMADRLINTNLMLEEKVIEKTAELQKANKKLEVIAQTDALTGLKNRGFFDKQIETEWRRNMRLKSPMSFILIDIDHFKSINDNKGHPVGDEYLKKIANLLSSSVLRAGDLLARYGGEEFIIVLNGTNAENAIAFANNIKDGVENLQLLNEFSSVAAVVTVSLGVFSVTPHAEISIAECIKCADEALYQAKRNGRNKAVLKSL